MKRAHVSELYTAYLEATLPEKRRQAVEAHLGACPRCADELEELRRLVGRLRALPEEPLPEHFTAKLRARLSRYPRRQPILPRGPVLAGGMLVAAAAALLLIVHLGRQSGTTVANLPYAATRGSADDRAAEGQQAAPPPPKTVIIRNGHLKDGQMVDPFAHEVATTPERPARKAASAPGAIRAAKGGKPETGGQALPAGRERIVVAVLPPEVRAERATSLAADSAATKTAPSAVAPATALENAAPKAAGGAAASAPSAGTRSVEPEGAVGSEEAKAPAGPLAERAASYAARERTDMSKVQAGRTFTMQDAGPRAHRLSFGALQAEAPAPPNEGGGRVALRLTGEGKGALTVSYARPAAGKEQRVEVAPLAGEIALDLPPLPDGAVLKLAFKGNETTDRLYLIVPGTGDRLPQVALSPVQRPMADVLAQLASAAGVFVLCPAAFAEQITSVVGKDAPLNALATLAGRSGCQTGLYGNVLNIVPAK